MSLRQGTAQSTSSVPGLQDLTGAPWQECCLDAKRLVAHAQRSNRGRDVRGPPGHMHALTGHGLVLPACRRPMAQAVSLRAPTHFRACLCVEAGPASLPVRSASCIASRLNATLQTMSAPRWHLGHCPAQRTLQQRRRAWRACTTSGCSGPQSLPPPSRGSTNVARPVRVSVPGRPAAQSRTRWLSTPSGRLYACALRPPPVSLSTTPLPRPAC